MTIARQLSAAALALLLGVAVAGDAIVGALVETNPQLAARVWPGHPDVELALGMTKIGAAAHRGRAVGPDVFRSIDAAAAKAPLAAQPYLVRGVQAQIAGNARLAQRAFEAAERRDPRSLPARYFLAEHYLRTGNVRRGLVEYAALARLAPNGILSATPFVASYARDPSRWPQLKTLFGAEPELQEMTLEAMARDPANTAAILALADTAHRTAASPWLPTLVASLVAQGQYRQARSIWAEIAHVQTKPTELLFDSGFSNAAPPAPFNWTLTSSTVGLAERQPGGKLHAIFYGQEDGVLASQLLILDPGPYRLAMKVDGGGPQTPSLRWTLTCANAQAPFATARLDALTGQPWTFVVPAGCGAQRLELAGSSSDIPQQVDVTLRGLSLVRGSER